MAADSAKPLLSLLNEVDESFAERAKFLKRWKEKHQSIKARMFDCRKRMNAAYSLPFEAGKAEEKT